jgi:hypothetical protein
LPAIYQKKLIIGIDEAGYGPRLGPLVIGGSAWLTPQTVCQRQLTDHLAKCFQPISWYERCGHVPLGDSKVLYRSGTGLASLESGLMALFLLANPFPNNLLELLRPMVGSELFHVSKSDGLLPWYRQLESFSVPQSIRLDRVELQRLSQLATAALQDHQLEMVGIKSLIIDEPDFNNQVVKLGSKGTLLSLASLRLAGQLWQLGESGQCIDAVEIFCDRQGGRKNYLPLLMHWMPDAWFTETRRSNDRCSYQSTKGTPVQVHFSVAGDRFPPTALASMTAKYVRERLMQSFNHFWIQHVDGLAPTAGYPTDAVRFREQIQLTARRLGLDSHLWWREK